MSDATEKCRVLVRNVIFL